jgi:hypothetical protein
MSTSCQLVLIVISGVASPAGAQTPIEDQASAQDPRARGYWFDPAIGLMWAGKDNNGKDPSWQKAMKYCRTRDDR